MKEQLSVGEAAQALGISESTVRRMADQGRIASWRLPGSLHRRIPRAAIERLQRLRTTSTTDPQEEPTRS
jgi:excisionase family DNA binding protein